MRPCITRGVAADLHLRRSLLSFVVVSCRWWGFLLFVLANVGEGKGHPAQHSYSPWMNDTSFNHGS